MAFKKISAPQLFDGFRMLNDEYVLVFTEAGIVEAIIPKTEAGEDIAYYDGIVSPGFINCHCHLELSHMQGKIAEHTGLPVFLQQVMMERGEVGEKILEAIALAENEMWEKGIVAVGDICNTDYTFSQKRKGRIKYHNFIEVTGFVPGMATKRFEEGLALLKSFDDLQTVEASSIVPHAPYSVATLLLEKIIHHPGNQLLTMHNQESAGENELFQKGSGEFIDFYKKIGLDFSSFVPSGKTSLQTMLEYFLPEQSLLLVHNVHTLEEDIIATQNQQIANVHWCLCPGANQYISGLLPPVDLFIQQDSTIVLGTDSLASNHTLSILNEINIILKNFPSIEKEKVLRWATSNGAQALQMDNQLGSFTKGKQPGVILMSEDLQQVKRIV